MKNPSRWERLLSTPIHLRRLRKTDVDYSEQIRSARATAPGEGPHIRGKDNARARAIFIIILVILLLVSHVDGLPLVSAAIDHNLSIVLVDRAVYIYPRRNVPNIVQHV